MRYDQMNLNLSGNNKRFDGVQKPIDDIFRYSDVTWGFELSEGFRPADPFMPNRFAPVVRVVKIKSLHRKGVVIPKGTIIGARPAFQQNTYWRITDTNSIVPVSGQTLSGQVALGIGFNSAILSADVDDMVEGYDNIRIVADIANGGAIAADPYSAYDVERQRVNPSGVLVTTSDVFTRPANIPIGVVTEDVYITDAGNKLNFNEISWSPFKSFLTDWFVEMPYCAAQSQYLMTVSADGSGNQTQGAGYAAALALGMPYLNISSLADAYIGGFIIPDLNGKYTNQYTGATNYSVTASTRTTQTVGKLTSYSNKYPEDLEGLVETWNTSKVGGTATYGLKYNLYVFMRAILKAVLGHEPTYGEYKDALESGKFGMARINLSVS